MNVNEIQNYLLEDIRKIIPYNNAGFYLGEVDRKTGENILCSPVLVDSIELPYGSYTEYYINFDYARWIFQSKKPIIYRDTDIMDNSLREKTEFFNDFLIPYGVYYAGGLTLVHNEVMLGTINFFREKSQGDFSKSDLFIFEQLQKHLAYRLYTLNKTINHSLSCTNMNKLEQYYLTNRELEIIDYLLQRLYYKEICMKLFISQNTLKKHINNIYSKLEVSNRRELEKKMIRLV